MKIIIAGAGIGGLRFAAKAAAAGHEVEVYERAESLSSMRYDWHDDVSRAAFSGTGIAVPPGSFPKKNWSFVAPDGGIRRMYEDLSESDLSVWRGALNEELAAAATDAGAKLYFGITVEGTVLADGRVRGVIAGGEKYADLVVDSTGAESRLKEGLDIDRPEKGEIFFAYRAFYEKDVSAPEAEHTNKVYLKHLGENGISWAIQDGDQVDVLIGRLGGLDKGTLENALNALKADNPTIGKKILSGGGVYKIPVRYPAAKMVANGYAAIGDAAFMTIPMLGSGIASSIVAADMLSECINSAINAGKSAEEASAVESLWNYEVAFYKDMGASHVGVDLMKRAVLKMSNEDLSWMLASKVLTNNDICLLAKGRPIYISPIGAAEKAINGITKLPTLLKVNNMLTASHRAIRIARAIPCRYDREKVQIWSEKLRKIVTKF